jgi:uncharacterized protein YyaL (SSP411 family)
MEFYLAETREVVIVGSSNSDLVREVLTAYLPNAVIAHSQVPEDQAAVIPLFAGREVVDGRPTAYVCENFVCQRPVTTVAEIRELILRA